MKKLLFFIIINFSLNSFADRGFDFLITLNNCSLVLTPTSIYFTNHFFSNHVKKIYCYQFDSTYMCNVIEKENLIPKTFFDKKNDKFKEFGSSINDESFYIKDRLVIYQKRTFEDQGLINEICKGVLTTKEQSENIKTFDLDKGVEKIFEEITNLKMENQNDNRIN